MNCVDDDRAAALLGASLTRRDMLRVGGVAGVGLIAFGTTACPGGKSLSTQIVIITESYEQIVPLLPELGLGQDAIDRVSKLVADAIKVAREFDKAYQAGAFNDAATLFKNLSGLISNIASELNVAQNRTVKAIIAGVGIARIVIAALIQEQGDKLPAAGVKARMNQNMREAMAEIDRLNQIPLPVLQ